VQPPQQMQVAAPQMQAVSTADIQEAFAKVVRKEIKKYDKKQKKKAKKKDRKEKDGKKKKGKKKGKGKQSKHFDFSNMVEKAAMISIEKAVPRIVDKILDSEPRRKGGGRNDD